MSVYRFLQDVWVGTTYYLAGTTASTVDVGGTLPVNWPPPGAVDPLDTPAVNAFYAVGPQLCGLIRPQWATQFVAPPVTRWVPGPGVYQWSLTGLGTGMVTSGGSLSLP